MVVTGVGRTEYVDGISAVAEAGVVIAEEGTAGHLVGADGVKVIGDAVAHGHVTVKSVCIDGRSCLRGDAKQCSDHYENQKTGDASAIFSLHFSLSPCCIRKNRGIREQSPVSIPWGIARGSFFHS